MMNRKGIAKYALLLLLCGTITACRSPQSGVDNSAYEARRKTVYQFVSSISCGTNELPIIKAPAATNLVGRWRMENRHGSVATSEIIGVSEDLQTGVEEYNFFPNGMYLHFHDHRHDHNGELTGLGPRNSSAGHWKLEDDGIVLTPKTSTLNLLSERKIRIVWHTPNMFEVVKYKQIGDNLEKQLKAIKSMGDNYHKALLKYNPSLPSPTYAIDDKHVIVKTSWELTTPDKGHPDLTYDYTRPIFRREGYPLVPYNVCTLDKTVEPSQTWHKSVSTPEISFTSVDVEPSYSSTDLLIDSLGVLNQSLQTFQGINAASRRSSAPMSRATTSVTSSTRICGWCQGQLKCRTCNGLGRIEAVENIAHGSSSPVQRAMAASRTKCRACNGTGRCPVCHGTGRK